MSSARPSDGLANRRLAALALTAGLLVSAAAGTARADNLNDSKGFLTAVTARIAAIRDAQDDFWEQVAICLNDTDEDLMECVEEASDEMEEAIAHADAVFFARITLLPFLGFDAYDPEIEPDDFSADITNPYFPLIPGRTLIYEADTDDGLERIEVTTLEETFEIAGVECRAVRDIVSLAEQESGEFEVIEDTIDWYAQDDDGNVWYFGEIARNFEDGMLDNLDGSWRHGKDGAKAGIIMLGTPALGDAYRQEWLVNEAEDYGIVLSLSENVTVPAGSYANCYRTQDATPLEPEVNEHKLYAPGIGVVKEINVTDGETVELIEIIEPSS